MLVNSTAIINLFVTRLTKQGSHSIKINRTGRSIMDLLHLQWKRLVRIARRSCLFIMTFALASCATAPAQKTDIPTEQETEEVVTVSPVEQDLEPEKEVENLPLTSELVYYILMAEIAGQRGEMGVAVDLYHKAATEIESPVLAGRSAQVATFTRDQQRISRALERWVEVDPEDVDVYVIQAPILVLQGDFDGAINAINAALELAPEDKKTFLIRIAEQLSELATAEQALNLFQQLKQYQAKDPEVLFAYAKLTAFYKQYEDAIAAVDFVLEQQPQREDALVLKAEILQRMGQGDAALTLLSQAVRAEDASDDLRFAYAKTLGENGKTEQSGQVFEQLHEANPQNDEIIFALGLLALEDKDGNRAKNILVS